MKAVSMRSVLLTGMAFGLAILTAGCPVLERPIIVIGAILPLTGVSYDIGLQEQNGIEIAADELNGLDSRLSSGPLYTLTYVDSKSDPALAVPAFQTLMENHPHMVALLSSTSRISSLIVPEAELQQVPVITEATSMPGITDNRPWAFRLHSTSAQEAQAMAEYWMNETSIRKVAFFYINDAMGQGARDTFVATFAGGDAQVVWEGAYEQTDTDFSAKITEALAAAPDACYVMGFIDTTVELIKQLHAASGAAPLPVGSNLGMATPAFVAAGGDAYEGIYFTALPFMFEKDTEGTAAYAFAVKYRAKYNREPDIYAGLAYDTLGMIADAVHGKNMSRDEFREAFSAIDDYEGVMGPLSIDDNREVTLTVSVAQLRSGKLEPVS